MTELIRQRQKKINEMFLFRTQQLSAEQDIDYKSCVDAGGKVVSHVFCLPQNYRKDVLPPTSKFSVDNCCNQVDLSSSEFVGWKSQLLDGLIHLIS